MKQVAIIGGSYAAILAFNTLIASTDPIDITIISPSEYSWNNTTAPRLLVEPERKHETIANLKQYVDESLEKSVHTGKFIKAAVNHVDLDEKVISFHNIKINFDYLIIASGARYESDAFKLSDSSDYQKSFDKIDQLANKIKLAQSVAIIGGGATGVEVAGEIGFLGGKKIDLYTGSTAPLATLRDSTRKSAVTRLEKLNIKVINNIKVDKYTDTSVTYGETTNDYDLVIPTFKSYPNSQFLDAKHLSQGFVKVNDSFFVDGYPNVIAFGDVASNTTKSVADIKYFQAQVVIASINHWFTNLAVTKYVSKQMMVVPISKNGGVGEIYGWSFPSFLIKILKGNDFMIKKSKDMFTS